MGNNLSEEKKEKIKELSKHSSSIHFIARESGTSRPTVRKYIEEYNNNQGN